MTNAHDATMERADKAFDLLLEVFDDFIIVGSSNSKEDGTATTFQWNGNQNTVIGLLERCKADLLGGYVYEDVDEEQDDPEWSS